MASYSRGRLVGFLTLLSLLAPVPLAALLSVPSAAEARKFVVLLAEPYKDYPAIGGAGGSAPSGFIQRQRPTPTLPNNREIWDYYFDQVKNGQPEIGGVRIDSHAEWWDEVSYGEVTVSGDVFGWVPVPWPTRPLNLAQSEPIPGIISHIPLQGDFFLQPGTGELFDNFRSKFQFDFDGVAPAGTDPDLDSPTPRFNRRRVNHVGLVDFDSRGRSVWTPGERFRDLNGNGSYDAGVREIGIDKNGNGRIDTNHPRFRATSWAQLFAAEIEPVPEGAPQGTQPRFVRWLNETEWFDTNGDGLWDSPTDDEFGFISQPAEFFVVSGQVFTLWHGDWGGREIWIDRNNDEQLGQRATPPQGAGGGGGGQEQPATFADFLFAVNDPQRQDVEWYDQQWNNNYDFPEPFEDFMRRWGIAGPYDLLVFQPLAFPFLRPNADHDFIRMDEGYIRANYPGDVQALIARTGNGRYDSPDLWGNNGTVNSSNKMQECWPYLLNAAERAEHIRRDSYSTGSWTSGPPQEPTWWVSSWEERYGPESFPPYFPDYIPYFRKFDPRTPIPQLVGQTEQPQIRFEPNRGGPFGDGRPFRNQAFSGRVRPDITDPNDGMYDGPAEYDDLPETLYHSTGDGTFGGIMSPWSNQVYGEDRGTGIPDAPGVDSFIEAAGPGAFSVHGNGGFDAGNVLTAEYLTWRTDGESLTDREVDLDGDGIPDIFWYHRDINLDGLLDLGETIGNAGRFGPDWLADAPLQNYGVDPFQGGIPNGGPTSSVYPFNRLRLMEDVVHALDEIIDWDDFLGGPLPFGDRISGVILTAPQTSAGMFYLPASALLSDPQMIRTRDRWDGPPDQPPTGRLGWTPIPMFDGLAISLGGTTEGEGSTIPPSGEPNPLRGLDLYQIAFSAHEYGHIWQFWPDLYDYDVRRPGAIDNNPVARWCVMAGGGLVHPVPILKQDAGWLTAVDITRELTPAAVTTLDFPSWERNRNGTVRVYENPLRDGEEFWIWRSSPGTVRSGGLTPADVNFNIRLPSADRGLISDYGLVIMHVDRNSDPEGLPVQQSFEGRFVYRIVQADGLAQLEAGENGGDAGDAWPGSTNARRWDRTTTPSNRWYNSQGSGLDIVDIRNNANSTTVDILWTPRELPTFRWIQPPGGTSVNRRYNLRYFAYDQFGGTTIEFFAVKNIPGLPVSYDNAIPLGQTTKAPGDVEGTFPVDLRLLPTDEDTYSFFAVLRPGLGVDSRFENSYSMPRAGIRNVGSGDLAILNVDVNISRLETWTVRFIGGSRWSVTGSLSGRQVSEALTGQVYSSDPDEFGRSALSFRIDPATFQPVPFAPGDVFTFLTTGRTPFSQAVLVFGGEVVAPVPPVARARVDNDVFGGLAPLAVTFLHDESFDPRGASIRFTWDFGDGSPPVTTTDQFAPITHTYRTAGAYRARLTVRNTFELAATADITITVQEAPPPTARLSAAPREGAAPLRVRFDGTQSSDPTGGGRPLEYVIDFGDGSPPALTSIAEHEYVRPGIYTATLTVTNPFYQKSDRASVEVRAIGPAGDQPPVAVIGASRVSGRVPLTVNFTSWEDANGNNIRDAGERGSFDPEGQPLRFTWNFGDRSAIVRDVPSLTHTYSAAGTYNATLTVTDVVGQSRSATIAIVATAGAAAGQSAPLANIRVSTVQGPAPLVVRFDGTGSVDPDGGNLSFAWTFGDDSPQAEGAVVEHTYTTPRVYRPRLAVRDESGLIGEATITINVTSPTGTTGAGSDNQSGQGVPPGGSPTPIGLCGFTGFAPLLLTVIGLLGLRRIVRRAPRRGR